MGQSPMPFTFRNKNSRGFVGLDLDGGYLAAAQVGPTGIIQAASGDLAPQLIQDGEVTDVQGLSAALKSFFAANGLPRNVHLGVAHQQILVRHLDLPRIEDEREREAAIRFQASEAIAMPLDEAVLDHQIIGESETPDGSPRLHAVVVAAREDMVTRLVDAVRGAGLRPLGIDLNAFALVRTLAPSLGGA